LSNDKYDDHDFISAQYEEIHFHGNIIRKQIEHYQFNLIPLRLLREASLLLAK
jgi:hypothetical protein